MPLLLKKLTFSSLIIYDVNIHFFVFECLTYSYLLASKAAKRSFSKFTKILSNKKLCMNAVIKSYLPNSTLSKFVSAFPFLSHWLIFVALCLIYILIMSLDVYIKNVLRTLYR